MSPASRFLVLMATTINSCGPAPPPNGPPPSRSPLTASEIVHNINRGSVSLSVGLSQIRTRLAIAHLDDYNSRHRSPPTVSTAASTPDPPETLSSVVKAFLSIDDGNDIDNLAILFGLNNATSGSASPKTANDLYTALDRSSSTESDDIARDAFLVRLLLLQKLHSDQETPDLYRAENAKPYFGRRIKAETIRLTHINPQAVSFPYETLPQATIATEVSSARLLQVYGALSRVFNDDEWTLAAFGPLLHIANLQDQVVTAQQAARDTLGALLNTSDSVITFRHLKNALAHLDWATQQLGVVDNTSSTAPFEELWTAMDIANRLFDKDPGRMIGFSTEEWNNLIERRFQCLRRAQQALRELGSSNPSLLDGESSVPLHPLSRVYYGRALLELDRRAQLRSIAVATTSLENYQSSSDLTVIQLGGIRFPTEARPQWGSPGEPVDRAKRYARLIVMVETGKYYLQEYTALHDGQPPNDANSAIRRTFSQLEEALNLRYADRLIATSPSPNAKTPARDALKSIADEATQTAATLVLRLPARIPAGIFTSDLDIDVTGGQVEFHPLALIRTAGRNVTIVADALIDPWIDTSGDDGVGAVPQPPLGSTIAFDSEVLSKAWHQPIDPKSRPLADRCFNPYNFKLLRHQQSPPRPVQSPSGSNAGTIDLARTATLKGAALFWAAGGNGMTGYQAGDSPYCNGGEYQHTGLQLCLSSVSSSTLFVSATAAFEAFSGSRGQGGNGGNGGSIILNPLWLASTSSALVIKGEGGDAGPFANCGPHPSTDLPSCHAAPFVVADRDPASSTSGQYVSLQLCTTSPDESNLIGTPGATGTVRRK